MISPPLLSKGSKVVILSTARKISEEEIAPAIELLKSWELKVSTSKHLFKVHHQFAGSREERLADLQKALDDPECSAIFCARGGYGSLQIVDDLDFSTFKKYPKWVVGFSDVTVLHAQLQQLVHCESIHACMPINYPKDHVENTSVQSLKNVLFGEAIHYNFSASHKLNRMGTAKGDLLGGNLSLLFSLTGSLSSLNTQGKILFIEDLDEYLYHIDRMMLGLKRAGMLSDLKALIVGGMSDMNDNTVPFGLNAEEIIYDNVKEFDYPLLFNFPAGHLNDNRALILGRQAEVTIDKEQATFIQENGRAQ